MSSFSNLFDLQVNGFARVDFNSDDLTFQEVEYACHEMSCFGLDGALATIITDTLDKMCGRIQRLAEFCHRSGTISQILKGIHVEGPFISPLGGFVGTHPPDAVIPASVDDAKRLVYAGEGLVRLVTLAPERDRQGKTTRWLTDHKISVSAGHCDSTIDDLCLAIDNGLSMFTHLGNGCPVHVDRHENIIQRVLRLSDRLWVCFIADGIHVPYTALHNYLMLVGLDRAIIVSDAISGAGLGPGEFRIGGQPVFVDETLATWSSDRSHLMGSATPLKLACANLVDQLGFTTNDAFRLCSINPKSALRFN